MILLAVLVALTGLAVGSFLGVCVYRIPRGLSVVRPRSFCPHCRVKLSMRDLIPLVSPVANGWGCRKCGERIPVTYTVVEVLTAAVFLCVVFTSPWDWTLAGKLALAATLIPIIWIDWEFFVIPNRILALGAAGVLLAKFFATADGAGEAVLTSLLAMLGMYCVGQLGNAVFRKPSLGMGDVKLSGFIALGLGLTGFLVSLWIGAIAALVYATIRARGGLLSKKSSTEPERVGVSLVPAVGCRLGVSGKAGEAIPFGSFLSGASLPTMILEDATRSLLERWLISIT